MILYKYTSLEGMIKTVQGASLLVRPINGYNDPFESLPVFSDKAIEDYFTALCGNSGFLRRLQQEKHILGESFTVPQLRMLLKDDPVYRKSILSRLLAQSKATPIEFAKDFQEYASLLFGLVSLTKNPSNILMWSHYADQHRGCVFSIETSLAWNDDLIYQVNYRSSRVAFTGKNIVEENKTIAFSKSLDWCYEKEYRLIVLVREDEWRETEGRRTAKVDLKQGQIRWICAGIRSTDEDLVRLREVLSSTLFRDVPVFRARLHPTDFKIVLPDECGVVAKE